VSIVDFARDGSSRSSPQPASPDNVEIVKRSDQAKGFVALPKRWIVERTFAWLGRCRRLAKDWECLNARGLAFVKLASIRLMIRKLCNPS
jgi:transposase